MRIYQGMLYYTHTCKHFINYFIAPIILCRPLIRDSLIAIMDKVISQHKPESTVHLLKALPLLHFIRGDCIPNEQRVVQSPKIVWLDHDIQLGTVRSTMLFVKRYVELKW